MRKDKRDSFIFYRSFYEAVKVLSKEDKADLFEAIAIYALDQKNYVLKPLPKAMFKLIKPQLDANYKRYSAGIKNGQKGAKHGKKGGRPKRISNNPQTTPKTTPEKPSNDNVNDNVNDNHNEKEKIFYLSPTFKNEVYNYFLDKLDDEKKEIIAKEETKKFTNYYKATNWVIRGDKITDWRSKASGWFDKIDQFKKRAKPVQKENQTGAQEFSNFVHNSFSHE